MSYCIFQKKLDYKPHDPDVSKSTDNEAQPASQAENTVDAIEKSSPTTTVNDQLLQTTHVESTHQNENTTSESASETVPESVVETGPKSQSAVELEVQQMIQQIQKEEKAIAANLRQEIEEKKRALEELRIQKEESEKTKKEKSRLLLEAQEALLREMQSKREEMTEIRKDIKDMRQSVVSQLSGAAEATEPSSGEVSKNEDKHQGGGKSDDDDTKPET